MSSNGFLWSSSSHETAVLIARLPWHILASLRLLSFLCLQWNLLAILPRGLEPRPPLALSGGFLNTLNRADFNLGPTERDKVFLMVSSPLLPAWGWTISLMQGAVWEFGWWVLCPCIFSLLTGSKEVPTGDFRVTAEFWSDLFLKDRSLFGSRGFLSGRSRQGWAGGSSLKVCLMFSKELTLLWPAWLPPETSAPEQLWVLSRGRHSSETHFRLPLESEGVDEFDVKSVDRFLLRKCLSRTEK